MKQESVVKPKHEWRLKRKQILRNKIKCQLERALDEVSIVDVEKRSRILFVLRHL
jgi:hypothetical protein